MATVINPFVAVDGNGHVRANAKLYFYQTGTTTPQNTFTDAALTVTATNPVVADSNGLFTAMYLGDPPDFTAYKAILKDSADVTVWTADPIAGAPISTPVSASLLRGYLAGLQRTANTTTTLTLSDGVCVDDTRTAVLSLEAGTINFATVGADGLDAGSIAAATSYHIFAIGKTDGTVARLASTSPTSPTMPSGYTLKRRIMSVRTIAGAATLPNFVQLGDEFLLSATISANTFSVTGVAATISLAAGMPTGVQMMAKIRARAGNSVTSGALFYSPDQGAETLDTPNGNDSLAWTGNTQAAGEFRIRTNTNAQINAVSGELTGATGGIAVIGWEDTRGRDD
ncbi:MAG: hypothetical protein K0R61_60 [Microvirga sp.]|jgi:hypothetical protein|nr:hypothetical protein [Microvirga sp.]MDF2969610.1 hypothetical protein [Microvirga sp.]